VGGIEKKKSKYCFKKLAGQNHSEYPSEYEYNIKVYRKKCVQMWIALNWLSMGFIDGQFLKL
jgi:hypothetical protein